MKQIDANLEIIKEAIEWVNKAPSMQGAKGENASNKLVNFRRELKRKKMALEDNPAAAIYGASQMGKSYLVSNLLSEDKQPFTVIDGKKKDYIFLDEINPIGRKTEATSLITRFSVNYDWINPEFPVKAKLLSLADLVLVLCDSYYHDLKPQMDKTLKTDAINSKVSEFCKKYESVSASKQTLFGEDDIWDIYDYLVKYIANKAINVIHSDFFKKISKLIAKIQPDEWGEIFAILWNGNEKITKLFTNLLIQYAKLNFKDVVYLPIESTLRKKGTLLDVARLKEIYGEAADTEQDYVPDTNVMIIENEKEQKFVPNFSKSYLCALTAELTFRLSDKLKGNENKRFLRNTDLLDFPGARNRLGIYEESIVDKDIPNMLLRGKVAYLFNKYSYFEKINILLLCQNQEKVEIQNILPGLISDWIGEMLGKTPEARNKSIDIFKIPPFFVISTMFNVDLEFDFNNDKLGNIDALNNRWKRRFITVLNEAFGSNNNWFKKWTTSEPNFQNIYLLRDFRFSTDTTSKLFKGFNENKTETEEIVHSAYPTLKEDLFKSFLEYPFVEAHFKNPEKSWTAATNRNKDGTELIIENLTIAADNAEKARNEKIVERLKEMLKEICDFLKDNHNSDDKAKELVKAIRTAGTIQAKLAIAFGANPYFLGTMMRELMLTQAEVHNLYQIKIRDIESRDIINMDKYNGIRLTVIDGFSPEPNDFNVNLERLQMAFEIPTLEECKEFFEKDGIDLNELFYGNAERVKNFSQVLADTLEVYCFEQHMPKKRPNLANIFSEEGLENVQNMLHRLFKKLQIPKIIANKIRHIDGYRNKEDIYEMIADISTEIINKFIHSVGLEYYDESNFNDLENTKKYVVGKLIWNHDDLKFEQNTRKEAAELITDMGNLPALLNQNPLPAKAKRLPNYRAYIIWSDLLKVGFITASGVPDYDVASNERLGKIIEQCQTINY